MTAESPTKIWSFLGEGGEMGARMRAYDWSATPFGSPDTWPRSLRLMLSACLNSPMLGTILWGPDLRMLYNDAYIPSMADHHPAALGRPVADIWGKAWEQVSPPFHRAMATGAGFAEKNVELPMVRRGRQETTYWTFTATAIREEDGTIVGLFNQGIEITEQVLLERQVTEERNRLAQLFEQAPTFMALLRGPDHRFELANPGYYQLIGHRQVLGKTVAEALPDAVEQGYLTLLDDVYRSGKTFAANGSRYAMQAIPGGPIEERYVDFVYKAIVDAAGQVSGIFVEGADVTARTLADRALRESEEQFRVFAQAVPNQVWAARADGYFNWFNERVYLYCGVAAGALDGTAKCSRVIHPEDLPAAARAWALSLAFGQIYETEFRVRRADGTYRWFLVRAEPVQGADGDVTRWVGTNTDIDERKRQGAELARLNETLEEQVGTRTRELVTAAEQLRQSQKMEAVGQLTGGLAHDFNNLLTGITGSLELLSTRIAQARFKDVDRYVNAAQGAARRAAALTHRLLAFSRRQTLDPKPTDVNRLVAGMEDLVRRTVGPAVAVETVTAVGLWPTLVDPNQLESALLNLCINARDAMPGGGRLTVETANRWLDVRGARERDLQPGQYISLCVSDTGTGMTPDVVSQAFDPFFTTKPLGEGTGLGLSMIYGFVRQSGGQARIYSEVNEGTMVCLYLPRYFGDAEEGEQASERMEAQRAEAGQTVLVVDDEPTVRMLVTDILEELGYAAIEAADGPAGLKLLQSDVRVDLLVTDVGLPGGMNGRQLADAARVSRPRLKVLFITGYAENAVVGNGQLDPGMHVMTKPFAMEALASRIKELIGAG